MLLKDSRTMVNLMRAFAGESQARNRYDMAAKCAKSEGLYIIERTFKCTAKEEQAHATVFYNFLKELNGQKILIDGTYPVNVYSSTLDHLKAAVENEYEEYDEIYKTFGDIAKEEGFEKIAVTFFNIAEIEKTHSERYNKFYEDLKNGTLFKNSTETEWVCTNCGHIHRGVSSPLVCPVCSHPQGYFEVLKK
jgi:rubrerythrin